jgi:biotin carboxylase
MRLLLLATTTGYQTRSFADAARRLGMDTVLGTDRCHALEDPWQDAALPLRFENPVYSTRLILEYAREKPIEAIAAVGDKPTVTAATAAEALGLPWHSPAAAVACHVKFRQREVYRAAGLNTPAFTCHQAREGAEAALASFQARGLRFPCVLKPVALSGSRGVIRADDPGEFLSAFRRIAALLLGRELQTRKEPASEQIMVEDYIPGREFALEGLMSRGRLRILALFDKPDPLEGPFFEETIYVTPSRLSAAQQQAIEECLAAASRALGLYHGPLHAEFRLNQAGPWPLEIAARPIGGLCARALRFTGGMPLEELLLRNAAGESLDAIEREPGASGVMMIPVPEAGIFERVEGEEEARAVPGIEEIQITVKEGQKLARWPEASSYPGFIFARGASPQFVEAALREAHGRLHFRVARDLQVMP